MGWRNKEQDPPPEVLAAALADGDRLVAAAHDDAGDQWVLASVTRLMVVGPDAQVRLSRPWLDVDRGGWDPESDTLQVTWVDGSAPVSWQLTGRPARPFTDAFRDRVQASVVLVRQVDLGPGRTAQVAIRKDLATRELIDQVVLGARARSDDQELARQVAVARATLRDQSGMSPLGA
ncbi:hypothetical protein [Ornithinimicrobium cryptoxanthini]|nr:hypothetical protein [Ornithinimicrobium cryptoxanthini]